MLSFFNNQSTFQNISIDLNIKNFIKSTNNNKLPEKYTIRTKPDKTLTFIVTLAKIIKSCFEKQVKLMAKAYKVNIEKAIIAVFIIQLLALLDKD